MTRVNFYSKEQDDMLLAEKQDKLTFDSEPTLDSANPVTSNGIKMALDELQALIDSGYIHYGYLPPENPYLGMFWYNNAEGKLYICVGVEGTTGRWSLIVTSEGGATWGNIQGDIRNQLDLMAELALKQDKLTAGTGIDITGNVVSSTVPVITVDAAPSASSENPLQNKVITQQLQNINTNVQDLEDEKQNKLTAGTNITIENDVISATGIVDAYTKAETDNLLADKQKKLIAGTGISLDENGNISATGQIDAYTKAQTDTLLAQKQDTLSASQITAVNSGINSSKVSQYDNYDSRINAKQNTLVSGSNIKTINNQSLLGSGNIDIEGSSYSAGNGIRISNNVISARAGTGVTVDSSGISVDTSAIQEKISSGNGIQVSNNVVTAKLGDGLEFDSNGAIKATGGSSGGVSTINNVSPNSQGNIGLSVITNSSSGLKDLVITGASETSISLGSLFECGWATPSSENTTWYYKDATTNQWVEFAEGMNVGDYAGLEVQVSIPYGRTYTTIPCIFVTAYDTSERDDGDECYIKSRSRSSFTVYCGNTGYNTIMYLIVPVGE